MKRRETKTQPSFAMLDFVIIGAAPENGFGLEVLVAL